MHDLAETFPITLLRVQNISSNCCEIENQAIKEALQPIVRSRYSMTFLRVEPPILIQQHYRQEIAADNWFRSPDTLSLCNLFSGDSKRLRQVIVLP